MARPIHEHAGVPGVCASCKLALGLDNPTTVLITLSPEKRFLQKYPWDYPRRFCPDCQSRLGIPPQALLVPVEPEEDIVASLKRMLAAVEAHIESHRRHMEIKTRHGRDIVLDDTKPVV